MKLSTILSSVAYLASAEFGSAQTAATADEMVQAYCQAYLPIPVVPVVFVPPVVVQEVVVPVVEPVVVPVIVPVIQTGVPTKQPTTKQPTSFPTNNPTLVPTKALTMPPTAPTELCTCPDMPDLPENGEQCFTYENQLPADIGGMTLTPGTYTTVAAIGLGGTLYLDAVDYMTTGVNECQWIFDIGAAFTSAALTEIVFINSNNNNEVISDINIHNLLSQQVYWHAVGAITIAAGATALGDMFSVAAITLGADAHTNPVNLISSNAAVTLGAGCTSGNIKAVGAISLGAGTVTGYLRSCAAVTLAAGSTEAGDICAGTAITLGAGATSGDLTAVAAISVGADAVAGRIVSGAAIDLGALAEAISADAGAALTLGAGAILTEG